MSDAASTWGSGFATAAEDVISAYEQSLVPSLFGPWAEVLLDAVNVAPGDHVLDVATGPGTVARPAAVRAGRAGRVVACDISPAMLAAGRRKPAEGVRHRSAGSSPRRRHWHSLMAPSMS